TYSIGVSIWYVSCDAVFNDPNLHVQVGKNPELQTLFFKLCCYLRSPVILVFVFDGTQRPLIKCGQ
ncbi:hypothetical protein L208DRAFT_1280850, partial [Tricholoma matsutake]